MVAVVVLFPGVVVLVAVVAVVVLFPGVVVLVAVVVVLVKPYNPLNPLARVDY